MICILILPHVHNKPVIYRNYLRIDLAAKCKKPDHSGLKNYGFSSPVGVAGIDSTSTSSFFFIIILAN